MAYIPLILLLERDSSKRVRQLSTCDVEVLQQFDRAHVQRGAITWLGQKVWPPNASILLPRVGLVAMQLSKHGSCSKICGHLRMLLPYMELGV